MFIKTVSGFILFFSFFCFAQNTEGKVGVEAGLNTNMSDYVNNTVKTSVQGGVLAEYLLSKNFSVLAKLYTIKAK